jgi:cytochrome c553
MSILPGASVEVESVARGARAAAIPFLILLAGTAVSGPALARLAAATVIKPGAADDFRAAYATPQDIGEGEELAQASCASCHGLDGISVTNGTPHIAGQRPAYLYLELRAYQAGDRDNEAMRNAVRFLSDEGLVKVAAYFASLDPAKPATSVMARPAAAAPDPVAAGKAAAASCGGCHGEAGISSIPGMPSLAGHDPQYLVAATKAYKSGQRKHEMMKALVAGLGDADVTNIAFFYSAQKAAKTQTPAPGDKAAGKLAAAACAACHGEAGVSVGATPSLAGQEAQYFVAAMNGYRDGSRANALMKGPATAVSEAVTKDLAAYYSSLTPQTPAVSKQPGTAEWASRCDRCHGVNGNSTDARLPALASQRVEYLEGVLEAYRSGKRRSPAMAAMSKALTVADVKNLATHYSRQSARSVVYIVLPAEKQAGNRP